MTPREENIEFRKMVITAFIKKELEKLDRAEDGLEVYDYVIRYCEDCADKLRELFSDDVKCAKEDVSMSNTTMSDTTYNQMSESTEPMREFVGLEIDMLPCSYIHGAKAPYYSITYREDGELFKGYASFSIDTVSEYLREYFIGQNGAV